MGLLLSRLYNLYESFSFSTSGIPARILMLGLDAAGKSAAAAISFIYSVILVLRKILLHKNAVTAFASQRHALRPSFDLYSTALALKLPLNSPASKLQSFGFQLTGYVVCIPSSIRQNPILLSCNLWPCWGNGNPKLSHRPKEQYLHE
jgi:hypothetical protein